MADFHDTALTQLWIANIEGALARPRVLLRRGLRGAEQLDAGVLADGQLYAIAFWLFYSETGSVIHPPVVGLRASKNFALLTGPGRRGRASGRCDGIPRTGRGT